MKWAERPVILLGHGVRAAGADPLPLLGLGVPVLTSWQAADLVDNRHPSYFGRPGIYGQRCANRVLYEADQIIAIGNRMSPWEIGHAGLRREQDLYMVDVDRAEAARFPSAFFIDEDAAAFCVRLVGERINAEDGFPNCVPCTDWLSKCEAWRAQYPWIEAAHADTGGYINSYRFMERLEPLLRPDEIIVTDVGAAMCPVFQALHLKPPQRLMTSGGLGEMGCGLPAAIGASFATSKGEVLAIAGDGGTMMNLQELQTIAHHKLPIKIIVFSNDGYAMIKGTHKNLKMPYTGVSGGSGVSMPDFERVAAAFGIEARPVYTWEDFDYCVPRLLAHEGPALIEVHIDPEQTYVPRLQPIIAVDGTITPAKFSELSPL